MKKKYKSYTRYQKMCYLWYVDAMKHNAKPTKMTLDQFNQIATEELGKLSTEELLRTAKKLSTDYSNAATNVFNVIIDILMIRLPENEFVIFCDSL